MEFVAFVGNDKEAWGQITALVKRIDCDKAIIVKDKNITGFPITEKCDVIEVNAGNSLVELKDEIKSKIKSKLSGDFEVSLSIASGNGKEHMALISALLSVPVGIRLVVFTKNGVEYIN